jgi:hypothetical protein
MALLAMLSAARVECRAEPIAIEWRKHMSDCDWRLS